MAPIIRNVNSISKIIDNWILVFNDDREPNLSAIFSGKKSYLVLMKDRHNNMRPHKVKIKENKEIGFISPDTFFHDIILY